MKKTDTADEHNESKWDRLLKIQTTGRDDSHADPYHYPYEPTPYSVLERMAESGLIGKKDVFLDYGSGKGRAGFFLSRQTGCQSIGVECDERIYDCATGNRKTAVSAPQVCFTFQKAEQIGDGASELRAALTSLNSTSPDSRRLGAWMSRPCQPSRARCPKTVEKKSSAWPLQTTNYKLQTK